jgi:hypothetical protein
MKIFQRLFCKHDYYPIKNDYVWLGWYKCSRCEKKKYIGDNCEFTHFHLGKFEITKPATKELKK